MPATTEQSAIGSVELNRHFKRIVALTGALGAYVTSHAIGIEGSVRESYLVDLRTPPAGWHTEIGGPVFGVH